jgi:hypothetical protein
LIFSCSVSSFSFAFSLDTQIQALKKLKELYFHGKTLEESIFFETKSQKLSISTSKDFTFEKFFCLDSL